jgi:hypothetical protein
VWNKLDVATAATNETAMHASVVSWCRAALPATAVLHHSPSEGKRGWRAQRWLKQSGCRAGWPDLQIHFGGRTLFLELKTPKGRVSDAQRETHAALAAAGFPVQVARTYEEATRYITGFIKGAR